VQIMAAALACLLLATGCRDRAPVPVPVTIANSMNVNAGLMHVALARDLLGPRGLTATVQRHAFGKLALEAVVAGRADVATVADTPVVLASLRGEPLVVLATIGTTSRNTVLVARREAGIGAARDLAGKRVGLAHGTTADFFLESLMVRHGLLRAALREVELRPDQMGDALERGEVDAVVAWYPTVGVLQRRFGDRVVTFDAPDIFTETFNLVARPAWVRANRPAAERLLAALLEAEAVLQREPDAAHRDLAGAMGVAPEELPKDLFEYRVRLEQGLVLVLEEQARWALRAGLARPAAPFDVLALIDAAPLAAVRPDAVRLIR